jgi:hypothetical protein
MRRALLALSILSGATMACGEPATPLDAARADAAADASPPIDTGASPDDAGPATGLDDLPAGAWSYVPIAGAVCGNGSPMAVGVNPHAGATELLVVMMGGGACWDAQTCFVMNTATHVHEDYTRAIFDMERGGFSTATGWDDRAAPLNPFREASIVFVPYCTGDLHAGDAVQDYPGAPSGQRVHHRGAVNTQRILDAVRGAWPAFARVRVIGFSAGGYGTQLNWGRFADAWPDAELALLADSAPLLQPSTAQYATWRAAWNMETPTDCTDCASTFSAYDDYFDARYPASRLGLMATTHDNVITAFWGIADISPLYGPLLATLDDNDTTRYFVVESDHHVILGEAATLRSADGTLLFDWLLGWLENDRARFHDTAP